ncbi:hypothetical protein TREPR_1154 [Treponema primitia ZAS-2]|uniref:Uncharacterized protein n=1 Tax=Treponema primitia (strain ATCC BAA-887 / DSM 12427 / ZAS-2) TaxID=545694 RepID=F5YGX3_TREPZ|nr:PD-(D/E)XK nuclease family transposase [Treponema primitia]AEF86484.1 hypothetical protein TREPR_1154 [Treponema primitia ZAS-2]
MDNKESDSFTENPIGKKRVQLKAEDDLLDISQDPIFKAVLTQDTPASRNALRFLVSAAIGQPVTIISVSTNEPPVRGIRDRQLRYDISVKFNDGSLGDIEMTVYPDVYEHFRQEYYLARLFTTQDIKGTELGYRNLKPTWQISLLGENIHADNALVHQFRYYDKENNLPFRGLTSIIDVELPKAEQFLETPVSEMAPIERWAVFFRYSQDPTRRALINEILDQEEGIQMAAEELLLISEDENRRFQLEHELKNFLDIKCGMVDARWEGYKQAKEEDAGIIQEKDAALLEKDREIAELRAKLDRP